MRLPSASSKLMCIGLVCSIHTHGGKCVQIVRDKPVLVIYGGKTTRKLPIPSWAKCIRMNLSVLAYDLKLIINKDNHDVVKPQWVRDCVAKEVLVPLRKKCVHNHCPFRAVLTL